ncbi:Snf7-domain-containing protein [Sphaerosporella brunnea]|uniref:Snf7-domain-containing protein n=1 Tax=Sphaerosporella brunnea TaxID=1250544 RepID=A0A5J5F3R2_9PEZI|nr:Snf7-domain-containing protein [Sphaerosporella brunnea]
MPKHPAKPPPQITPCNLMRRLHTPPPTFTIHRRNHKHHGKATPQTLSMNRLFGAKTTAPKPTLQGAISNLDTRIESIDVQLAKINAELTTYQQRISKMRDGPGKQALKQKAIKVLQRRKMYETQKEQLEQQSWNMQQAGMMQDNLKNVMVTVDAMKTTNKELRKQYGKVNIDKIEQMQDEMADLMDIGNDIQESISRSYDIPDEVDEAELDAELEALGDEIELGGGWEAESSTAVPGFLEDAGGVPEFLDEPPVPGKIKEAV